MPHDQFGRDISVGDTVTIKGEVVKVLDDPNYLNCTVKLAKQMPPTGTDTTLQLNTAQLEKSGGGEEGDKASKSTRETASPGTSPPQAQQKPPEHKR